MLTIRKLSSPPAPPALSSGDPAIADFIPDDSVACFVIRRAVFVVEQGVPLELEMDDLDAIAVHFLARLPSGEAVGCARAYPYHGEIKIGRVAVLPGHRGRGIGAAIMEFLSDWARAEGYPGAVLHAQSQALSFYERLGYSAEGPEFDEAGIPHRRMRKDLQLR